MAEVQPTETSGTSTASPAFVLVHGAGHTASVWRDVQQRLRHPSVALDLPGRADASGDLARTTIDEAAAHLAGRVRQLALRRVILVGHSAGGIVLPRTASRLRPQVEHLVFVAGLSAAEGRSAGETFAPGTTTEARSRLEDLRRDVGPLRFASSSAVPGHTELDDRKLLMTIDSLNYITQEVSWYGVDDDLPRAFVRPLRDSLQSREIQDQLARNCNAGEVFDVDAGHNPMADAPDALADILDSIAARHDT
jgi:pimeloyl-ACP methyl ester carboxylesterase